MTVAAAVVALSCAPGAPMGDGDARSAMEAVLQRRADATRRGDLAALAATIDQSRAAFRRVERDRFELTKGMADVATVRVLKTEPYGERYVRAYVEERPEAGVFATAASPSYRRVYFRRAGASWVLTEPAKDELGGERSRSVEDVRIEHWGIDEDVVDLVAREALAARELALRIVPDLISLPLALRLYPTAETSGLISVDVAAAHVVTPGDPLVRVYQLWLTPSLDAVAPFARFVLRDQVLGRARDVRSPLTYFKLDWWLRAGLGERSSELQRADQLRAACREALPTFKQLFEGPPTAASMAGGAMGGGMEGTNVAPTYSLVAGPGAGSLLALARSRVDYLAATYGERAYWDLADAYRDTPDPNAAYAIALKTKPDTFHADWSMWLKKTFC